VGNVNVIVAVPADAPVITPVEAPTVATPILLLLHVDVPEMSDSVDVPPTQTTIVPVIGAGVGLTVTFVVAWQPVGSVYVIAAVPEIAPLAMPDEAPIAATEGVPLLHVPPVEASLRTVIPPGQSVNVPVIAAGSGLTVTTVVT